MSTKKEKIIKSIKTINIKHKFSNNFGNLSTNSNETVIIKTNNNYNTSKIINVKKNNSINISRPKPRLHSAQINNKFNKISKSTLAVEKNTINKFYNYFNYNNNIISNNDNKENKQNQVSFIFNNSLLNNCYNNKNTKVNTYYLKLNKVYNPNHNYFRIVKDEKNIIKELISQTKNNFNNTYKLLYVNPDSKKRNQILKSFNNLRANKSKNIDKKNSIEIIASKEFNKYINNNMKNMIKKNNINKRFAFPSSFNMRTVFNRNEKIKLKTMKITNEISKQNFQTIENKNKIYKTTLYKNKLLKEKNENFFKTLPKNNKNNNNNDNYLDY